MNALSRWQGYAEGLEDALVVGRKMVAEGEAYIYRVAHSGFEVAFVRYLAAPQATEWTDLLREALALFALSNERNDTLERRDYPFNRAALLMEWYLGQGWLGERPDPALLDRSINLYAEGLWAKLQRPLSALAVLPPGYLLRQDAEHLTHFWEIVNEAGGLDRLPAELALWRRWSVAFLEGQSSPAGFWSAYVPFASRLDDPTNQPARFYLAAAQIGLELFGVAEPHHEVVRRLTGVAEAQS